MTGLFWIGAGVVYALMVAWGWELLREHAWRERVRDGERRAQPLDLDLTALKALNRREEELATIAQAARRRLSNERGQDTAELMLLMAVVGLVGVVAAQTLLPAWAGLVLSLFRAAAVGP